MDKNTSLQSSKVISAASKKYWHQLHGWFAAILKGTPEGFGTNQRLLVLLVVSALLIAVLINTALWWHDRDFRSLYGYGENYNMAAIIDILDKQGIGYRINPDDGQLLVHANQLSEARMAMAAGGIIAPGSKPWMPEASAIGSSRFVEQMQFLRSLEMSLSETISGINAVRYARVHLSVPEQSVFFRSRPAAKASVYLELYSGMRLQPDQVEGIMRLVSGSIATLNEQDVTVVDQYGNLLSQSIATALITGSDGTGHAYLKARTSIESHLELQLSKILDAVVGPGYYRVDVAADLTYDKIEQNSEQFDPNTLVLRSESVESGRPFLLDKPATIGQAPSVPAPGTPAPEFGGEEVGKQKVIRNYEVSRQISNETRYPGQLKRLTIAVVIDDGRLKPETTVPDSEARLTTLIKQASGFDASRGDTVSLAILPFATVPPLVPANDQKSFHRWLDLGNKVLQLILLATILSFIVLGCRRLLRADRLTSPGSTDSDRATVSGMAEQPRSSMANDKIPADRPPVTLEEQVARYRELAQDEPEKVAAVLKEWIKRNHANG
ncbi:flagellar basal-body MS-ring/collar protein FliF [Endozoicomonas sp. GU-1]|uniref:flagellar basal-body MS-ring/collar protein FliF n=1 Tax=Endozoicomonas sp. GU-1 TaxID=3009078 RepID=UPI0022B3F0C7|nr:flagellar basal-body MS-ring/collar protein FliF [Endozoicomonas sp. GU-1]WBA82505.1 flagellar basal-body MS-ring/collar protein FliF [Endozoicomonas sp. GU-1]WBA85437.1 flagellar basal-body MS-ring/collar protein FliF [Endozoicomonas sp. GU-1]